MMSKNCEECLALTMLLENSLIGDDAKISDCPDIISKDENIEVTSAVIGKIENRLNFGLLPKENEYINMSDYNCDNCEFSQKCKEESKYDYFVYCEKCKDKHFWLKDNFVIISKGSVYFVNKKHPEALPWPEDYYGSSEDLKKAIKRKEEKSKKYKEQNLSLFLFYDKGIEKIKPITSEVFKNIYIFCVDNGNLYKNWNLIKTYRHSGHTNCHNTECNEYGKFNN